MTEDTKVLFENGHGIKVTDTHLRTRYKNEALAPVESVRIGREPLMISAATGAGLALFALQFGDLLFWYEQMLLSGIGLLILLAGYAVASLRIGQYMHEKSALWSSIRTISQVREAIVIAEDFNRKTAAPRHHSAMQ